MSAHDARHTVYFMQMFDATLRDGALYPRWAADMVFGYGYPLWIILAPLPYYVAEIFHLVGLDLVSAVKALDATALVASGLAMYLFASRVLGRDAGLVAAVAYLFIPYHVVDLYVRGAGPEFLAFVFPPLVLWALYGLFSTRRLVYVPLVGLAYAGLILTHISMAVLFSPVIGGYVILMWLADGGRSGRSLVRLALSAVGLAWGLALAAVFLLPVLAEQRYLTSEPLIGGFFDFRLHFLNPSQLVSPFWGYGYAGVNGNDQFSLQLGIVPLFLGLVALFAVGRIDGARPQIIYFALVAGAVVLAMLAVSSPLWEAVAPIAAFAQFPWRLLFVTAVALAFLAGASVRALSNESTFPGAVVFSLLLVAAVFPFARPQYSDARFTWSTLMDFQVKDREMLGDTIWVERRPDDSPLVEQYRAGNITQKAVVVQGTGTVELVERRAMGDTVRVSASTPARLMFYTRYFPGWTATVDGTAVAAEPFGEQGLVSLNVPAGNHTVTTRFEDTLPRQLGGAITVLSALAAGVWMWRRRGAFVNS